jgi:hypothetical protein
MESVIYIPSIEDAVKYEQNKLIGHQKLLEVFENDIQAMELTEDFLKKHTIDELQDTKKLAKNMLTKKKDSETVVLVWGRFQAPHKGHGGLFEFATNLEKTADVYIYPTGTCEQPKPPSAPRVSFAPPRPELDRPPRPKRTRTVEKPEKKQCEDISQYPFTITDKLWMLHKLYEHKPEYVFTYLRENNIATIIKLFGEIGYKNCYIVCGPERKKSYSEMLLNGIAKKTLPFEKGGVFSPDERVNPIELANTNMNSSGTLARAAFYYYQDDILYKLLVEQGTNSHYKYDRGKGFDQFTKDIIPIFEKRIGRYRPRKSDPVTLKKDSLEYTVDPDNCAFLESFNIRTPDCIKLKQKGGKNRFQFYQSFLQNYLSFNRR